MTGAIPTEAELRTVARARLGLPGGEVDEGITRFYPDHIEGCYLVPLFDGDEGGPVVIHTGPAGISPHGGFDVAAARLRALDLLAKPAEWLESALRPVLEAVGAMSPGRPRWPDETVTVDGGAAHLVFTEDETWVRYAAGGAHGPPPLEADRGDARGITPPAPQGTMTCILKPGYDLRWTYEAAGEILATLDGRPDAVDAGDGAAPSVEAVTAEWAVAAARKKTRSPLAVPAAFVRALGETEWQVRLLGRAEPVAVTRDDIEDLGAAWADVAGRP